MDGIIKLLVILYAVSLSACTSWLIPKPVETEYFSTSGGGFQATLENGVLTPMSYGAVFLVKKELPEDGYMVVSFENPANRQDPFIEEGSVQEMREQYAQRFKNVFVLNSPPITGVRKHTQYEIVISVFTGPDRQTLLTRHQQKVGSSAWGR